MINWTIRAQRHLRSALAEALSREYHETAHCPRILRTTMQYLNEILTKTFTKLTGSTTPRLVVQNQFLGFRRKEDLYILLVEDCDPDRPGLYVVKIGPEDLLEKELNGWDCCRPVGLHNDLVFLPLQEGVRVEPAVSGAPRMMSLVYGDAQQLIGVETTRTFEAAVLEAIQFGVPTVQSVGFVLVTLYERIGHLLYTQSFLEDPAQPGYAFDACTLRLNTSLAIWAEDPEAQRVRQDANSQQASGIGVFLDPVDYLRYVQQCVPWQTQEGVAPQAMSTESPQDETAVLCPQPKDIIPRMLRGCAHGDVHGRNILVGIVDERMLWPTIFDYEDMRPDNLLGWDFVKLETELKIRAYLNIFAGGETLRFVNKVRAFEQTLNAQTEHYHREHSWPTLTEKEHPVERLLAILLELRRLASLHLGVHRGRPNEWLEEYYFLLACYGVTTVRFANLQHRERLGTFLSAGVATARLTWPRRFYAS